MVPARSLLFSEAARVLGNEARRRGLIVPGFRCPPRAAQVRRAIRRYPDGNAIVCVRLRGRHHDDVVGDMVEGVIVANCLRGAEADKLRADLRAAAGVDVEGAPRASAA